jgi:hypothetical protein
MNRGLTLPRATADVQKRSGLPRSTILQIYQEGEAAIAKRLTKAQQQRFRRQLTRIKTSFLS